MLKRIIALLFIIVLAAGCDNEHYTEYGGEITTLDGSAMSSMMVSAALESQMAKTDEDQLRDLELELDALTSMSVADRMGNMVQVPENAGRIVSLTPAFTEILVGLGLGDSIIAADVFSSDVAGVDVSVCTLDMINPDIQEIAALMPDIVVLGDLSGGTDTAAELDNMGIYTAYIPTAKSIEAIKMDIEFLAALTGRTDEGIEIISDMNTELAAIASSIEDRVIDETDAYSDRTPTVYLEISEYPDVWVVAGQTFIAAAIDAAGGQHYFAGENGYLSLTDRDVLGPAGNPIAPDVIISAVAFEGYDFAEILSRAGWGEIEAVREGKVYSITANTIMRPSQHITKGIREIAEILFPTAF